MRLETRTLAEQGLLERDRKNHLAATLIRIHLLEEPKAHDEEADPTVRPNDDAIVAIDDLPNKAPTRSPICADSIYAAASRNAIGHRRRIVGITHHEPLYRLSEREAQRI